MVIRKEADEPPDAGATAEARVLIIDDAPGARGPRRRGAGDQAGFRRFLQVQEEFKADLRMLMESGVRCVLVERSVDPWRGSTDRAGVLVVRRVAPSDLASVAELWGAPSEAHRAQAPPEEGSAGVGIRRQGGGGRPPRFLCITGGRGQRRQRSWWARPRARCATSASDRAGCRFRRPGGCRGGLCGRRRAELSRARRCKPCARRCAGWRPTAPIAPSRRCGCR